MANFLRSFGTGFLSAANQRFAEDRKLQIANDAAKAKLIREKILPDFQALKISGPKSKKDLENSLSIINQLGGAGSGVAQAAVAGGLITTGEVPEFLQNIPSEVKERLAADPFSFTPGQTGKPSLEEFARQRGVSVNDLIKAGIDPSQFPGTPGVAPQVTRGPEDRVQGFDITQALPSPQEQRVEKLATAFVGKANMFASNQDFNQAKRAFRQGDFETVLDLTARSPNIQNNIFLPILEQILESGIDSLNPNQIILLDLYRQRDPLTQMMNMFLLQNKDEFEIMMKELVATEEITEPPGPDASDEENFSWWEQNIAPILNWATERWNKIRGRKQ
jgi:hypothetical protein